MFGHSRARKCICIDIIRRRKLVIGIVMGRENICHGCAAAVTSKENSRIACSYTIIGKNRIQVFNYLICCCVKTGMPTAVSIGIDHVKITEPFEATCTANHDTVKYVPVYDLFRNNIGDSIIVINISVAIIELITVVSYRTQHVTDRSLCVRSGSQRCSDFAQIS